MKTMKKLMALIMALAIVMSLGITAFAADPTGTKDDKGTITISNAFKGVEYKVYQLMYLDSYDAESGLYTYKIDPETEMGTFIQQCDLFVVDAQNVVIKNSDLDGDAFCKELQNQMKDYFDGQTHTMPAPTAEGKLDGNPTENPATGSLEITGVPVGYYYIDTNLGAFCSIDTTNPNATVSEKNTPPVPDKVIVDSDDTDVHSTANVGDTVKFKVTVQIKAGQEDYKIVDTMANGLKLNQESLVVYHSIDQEVSEEEKLAATTDYTVETTEAGYTVAFVQEKLAAYAVDSYLIVTYDAVLTEEAIDQTAENSGSNTVVVKYGHESAFTSEPQKTNTQPFNINIQKYFDNKGTPAGLADAKFKLYAGEKKVENLVKTTQDGSVFTVDPAGDITEFVTPANGFFSVKGLKAGTYILEESAHPNGYNDLAGDIIVKIAVDGKVTFSAPGGTDTTSSTAETIVEANKTDHPAGDVINIENNFGTELPSTGGIGTTIFYIVGAVLMAGALILLITRKKVSCK